MKATLLCWRQHDVFGFGKEFAGERTARAGPQSGVCLGNQGEQVMTPIPQDPKRKADEEAFRAELRAAGRRARWIYILAAVMIIFFVLLNFGC